MSVTTMGSSAWQTRAARIVAIQPEIEGVATYDLALVDPAGADAYRFQPGQFNMLYLPGVGESAISHSGDCRAKDIWRHTVRVAGRVTQTLASLTVGSQLGVRGPFGVGWPIDAWVGRDVILVAGGIGLPPLRPAIYELLRRRDEFGQVNLIYGAREPRSLLYTEEFREWTAQGMNILPTVDRADPDWNGHQGVVTTLLDRLRIPRPEATAVAICGPEVMIRYTALSAVKQGVGYDDIWVSLERNMQCAAGLCGHCQLGPEFICKDGPVLRYDRVRHLLAVESL
jgi:NAD(P)H-flavin reductase